MSFGDYITNGLGRLQDSLFQVDPNVAGAMSADQLKGARQNALLHLGLGIIAGNNSGYRGGLGRGALLGLSDAENSFNQQTGQAYALSRQKQQDAEAAQIRALQMGPATAAGLGQLAGNLQAAPAGQLSAKWHQLTQDPTNRALLSAHGLNPDTITPEQLPGLMEQWKANAPRDPLIPVGADTTLYDTNTKQPVFSTPSKPAAVPDDLQGYQLAQQQGFKGSLLDYKQKLASFPAFAAQAAQGMTGFGPAADAAIRGGVTGDAFLKTLPTTQGNIVKALADGRMAFPAGFALKSPYWQQMLSAVSQYDPTFDAVNFNARSSTRKDFTSGKSSQNIKALNTAIGHLGTLASQIPGTASHSWTFLNNMQNAGAQAMGDSGPTQFKQTAGALASELTNVFRGSGGAEADVKRYLDELDVNGSKAQKAAAVKNITELLHSRIEAIGDQYNKGMGKTSDSLQLLDPKAQTTLARLGGGDASSLPVIEHHSGATIQLLP